nr:dna polymerase alpha catalytic subunit [Quercus suber]
MYNSLHRSHIEANARPHRPSSSSQSHRRSRSIADPIHPPPHPSVQSAIAGHAPLPICYPRPIANLSPLFYGYNQLIESDNLPCLLKYLVGRRKRVKQLMRTESSLKVQQLDILQQALKLTANRWT